MKKYLLSAVFAVAVAGLFAQSSNAKTTTTPKPTVSHAVTTQKPAQTNPTTTTTPVAARPAQQPAANRSAQAGTTTDKAKMEHAKKAETGAAGTQPKKHHRKHKKTKGANTTAPTAPKSTSGKQ